MRQFKGIFTCLVVHESILPKSDIHFTGTKLAIRGEIVGRPIRHAEDPGLLLDWCEECGESHQERRLNALGVEKSTFTPSTVVDVSSRASHTL